MSEKILIAGDFFLDSRTASSCYSYTHDYVMRLCRERKFPAKKVKGRWYVHEIEFHTFVRDQEILKRQSQRELSRRLKREYARTSLTGINGNTLLPSRGSVHIWQICLLLCLVVVGGLVAYLGFGGHSKNVVLVAGSEIEQGASVGLFMSGFIDYLIL